MKLIPDMFYMVDFCIEESAEYGPKYESEIVNYIGELNGRYLFDSLSTVRVLGPLDRITHGPSNVPGSAYMSEYEEE